MDTTSRLVFETGHRIVQLGVPLAIGVIAMAMAFMLVVAIAGLLQPASETVVLAPFRWRV